MSGFCLTQPRLRLGLCHVWLINLMSSPQLCSLPRWSVMATADYFCDTKQSLPDFRLLIGLVYFGTAVRLVINFKLLDSLPCLNFDALNWLGVVINHGARSFDLLSIPSVILASFALGTANASTRDLLILEHTTSNALMFHRVVKWLIVDLMLRLFPKHTVSFVGQLL